MSTPFDDALLLARRAVAAACGLAPPGSDAAAARAVARLERFAEARRPTAADRLEAARYRDHAGQVHRRAKEGADGHNAATGSATGHLAFGPHWGFDMAAVHRAAADALDPPAEHAERAGFVDARAMRDRARAIDMAERRPRTDREIETGRALRRAASAELERSKNEEDRANNEDRRRGHGVASRIERYGLDSVSNEGIEDALDSGRQARQMMGQEPYPAEHAEADEGLRRQQDEDKEAGKRYRRTEGRDGTRQADREVWREMMRRQYEAGRRGAADYGEESWDPDGDSRRETWWQARARGEGEDGRRNMAANYEAGRPNLQVSVNELRRLAAEERDRLGFSDDDADDYGEEEYGKRTTDEDFDIDPADADRSARWHDSPEYNLDLYNRVMSRGTGPVSPYPERRSRLDAPGRTVNIRRPAAPPTHGSDTDWYVPTEDHAEVPVSLLTARRSRRYGEAEDFYEASQARKEDGKWTAGANRAGQGRPDEGDDEDGEDAPGRPGPRPQRVRDEAGRAKRMGLVGVPPEPRDIAAHVADTVDAALALAMAARDGTLRNADAAAALALSRLGAARKAARDNGLDEVDSVLAELTEEAAGLADAVRAGTNDAEVRDRLRQLAGEADGAVRAAMGGDADGYSEEGVDPRYDDPWYGLPEHRRRAEEVAARDRSAVGLLRDRRSKHNSRSGEAREHEVSEAYRQVRSAQESGRKLAEGDGDGSGEEYARLRRIASGQEGEPGIDRLERIGAHGRAREGRRAYERISKMGRGVHVTDRRGRELSHAEGDRLPPVSPGRLAQALDDAEHADFMARIHDDPKDLEREGIGRFEGKGYAHEYANDADSYRRDYRRLGGGR